MKDKERVLLALNFKLKDNNKERKKSWRCTEILGTNEKLSSTFLFRESIASGEISNAIFFFNTDSERKVFPLDEGELKGGKKCCNFYSSIASRDEERILPKLTARA